jgi:branched-chain amino acid transport system ATP-binding protein
VTAALRVRGLVAGYDRSVVIDGLDLEVGDGATAVVIGPNGHGKTTLLRAISGLIEPMRGEVELAGERIDGLPAEAIAARGLVHVMQGDGLFVHMTVEENLLMGAFPSGSWRERRAALARV